MAKPSAIHSLTDLRAGINFMVYGDNGTGKTPFIGSSDRCLILNADFPDSVMSARVAGSTADVWNISDWNDADEAHEYLRHERHGYDWVWLDSVDGLQVAGMEMIMEDLVAVKKHRDRYVPDQPQYLQNMNRLKTFIRYMSGLPFNFGVTAHPFRYEIDGKELVWPFVQGKNMPQTVCGFMNIIGFLRIERVKEGGTQQALYTKGLPRYYARDRFSALPKKLVNPTVPQIEKLVREKVGGAVRDKTKPVRRPATKPVRKAGTRPIRKAAK